MLSWQSSLQCCVNCNCSISLSLLSHVIVKQQRMSCKEYLWQILNVNNCSNCFLRRYNTSSAKIMKTWNLQFSSSYLDTFCILYVMSGLGKFWFTVIHFHFNFNTTTKLTSLSLSDSYHSLFVACAADFHVFIIDCCTRRKTHAQSIFLIKI